MKGSVVSNQPSNSTTKNVNTLCTHHFCINGEFNFNSILQHLDIQDWKEVNLNSSFDWNYLNAAKDNNDIKFVLTESIKNWTYLLWNVTEFEVSSQMATYLSEQLETRVSYFYIDPWVAVCSWAISDRGTLIQSYDESHGEVLTSFGDNPDVVEFWEDKFWNAYERTAQPIDELNKLKAIKCAIGEKIQLTPHHSS